MKKSSENHGGKRKNSGRKPTENPKTAVIQVRTTPDKLQELREKHGENLADWVRGRLGL